jgi:hypothetical protein
MTRDENENLLLLPGHVVPGVALDMPERDSKSMFFEVTRRCHRLPRRK